MRKRTEIMLLLAVLAVGLGLRLWNFGQIAPMNPDEGMYLRQARFMKNLALTMVGVETPVVDASKEGIWRHVRKSDWYDKPCWLHSALIVPWMFVFGETDAAGAANSILFSMLTVWLVYRIGKQFGAADVNQPGADRDKRASSTGRLTDVRSDGASVRRERGSFGSAQGNGQLVGLLSAFFLSVSGYWMIYSRSMMAEVDSAFFVVLAFYLVLLSVSRQVACPPKPWRRGVKSSSRQVLSFLAGISAALAVLCHYRLLYIIAPLLVVTVVWRLPCPPKPEGRRGIAATAREAWIPCVALVAGFVATLGAVALVLQVAVKAIGPGFPFSGLLGALMERYAPASTGVKQTGFQPGNIVAYGYYLFRNNGITMTLMAPLAPVLLLVPRVGTRKSSATGGLACSGSPLATPERSEGGSASEQSSSRQVVKSTRSVTGLHVLSALLIMILCPLAILTMQIWVVARAASVILPFVALLAGVGATSLICSGTPSSSDERREPPDVRVGSRPAFAQLRRGKRASATGRQRLSLRLVASALIFLVIVAENTRFDIRLARNRMGHEAVCEYLRDSTGAERVSVPVSPSPLACHGEAKRRREGEGRGEGLCQSSSAVYADPESLSIYAWYAPDLPYRSINRLATDLDVGAVDSALVVFDAQTYQMYVQSVARRYDLEQRVAALADRPAPTPSLTTMLPEFLLDGTQAHDLDGMLQSLERASSSDLQGIRIYGMGGDS